ncbi:RNA-directed DNA polymerase, eukaryota [Tanacetum coccineum]
MHGSVHSDIKLAFGALRCPKGAPGNGDAYSKNVGFDLTTYVDFDGAKCTTTGIWGRIVKAINSLHEKELVPLSFLQRRVGNGDSTKFWHETWMGNSPLKSQFPRLFRLALNKDCTIRECWNNGWDLSWSRPITSGTNSQHLSTVLNLLSSFTLSDAEDSWSWSLGSPSFTVKCTREHIDNNILPDGGMETRWNRYLPKKINIFIWRVLRDRLPTRWNLSHKGIDLDSLNCLICDTSVETTNHSLWFCSLATTLWHRVFVWLDIAPPNPSNIQDVFSWLDNMSLSSAQKSALEVICGVVFWSLWHFRNKLIFYLTTLLIVLIDGFPLETISVVSLGTIGCKTL